MMEGKLNSRVIRGRVTSLPQIDPTLCKAGQAADAKATGDYLRLLSSGGGISKEIAAHMESRDNPHSVTAAQLGLGQVSNTADADKPVSLLQQRAIADACDQVKNAALLKSGGTMAGQLSMGGHRLTGLAAPEGAGDGVGKGYLEDYVNQKTAVAGLFSPVVHVTDTSFTISGNECGKTLLRNSNTDCTFHLSQRESKLIPTGAEIAISELNWGTGETYLHTWDGVRTCMAGESIRVNAKYRLGERNALIGLMKVADDVEHDCGYWLICGPVEVVE